MAGDGGNVVHRVGAPGHEGERHFLGPDLVTQRGVFQVAEIHLDADLVQEADHRFCVIAVAIGEEVDREAVRITGFGKQGYELAVRAVAAKLALQ